MKFTTTVRLFGAAAVASLLLSPAAQADSGFYLGGAVGDTSIDFGSLDDSDTSWKIMGGYIFDFPVLDFAIEAAYVDFGAPSGEELQVPYEATADALTAMGVLGVDFGLVGIFAKAGFASWDGELEFAGVRDSDSGTDPGYGVGIRLNFSSVEVRAEYEVFEFDDVDVDMTSIGLLWRF